MSAPPWQPSFSQWLVKRGLAVSMDVDVSPLAGGQSNPTYRVKADRGEYVLRKKPQGRLEASAHAIDREYRVMGALQGTKVPVPRMLAWEDDVSFVGTPFYVMEYLAGRVFVDQSLPDLARAERGAIYAEMNRVLARLHAVDYRSAGLSDYGRQGNYVGRQLNRWSRQCELSTLPLPPAMRRLMDWLPMHVPKAEQTSLAHGDFRLDNLVFHSTEPRVIGVLDWELSTLGDPLADFAYHCMSWRIPSDLWRGIGGQDLGGLGIPEETAYIRQYEESSGRSVGEHWEFYMAYNLFRASAILHGIAQRAQGGNASAADAIETGRKAAPLAEIGWKCVLRKQGGIS
jgi:acyl-CoA dehydrogenase